MRRAKTIAGAWVAFAALTATAIPAFGQGPGGTPGMPMQRMGPGRSQATGMGTPGAPMARLSRGGGFPQAAPSRKNYGSVPGVMSSKNYRGSSMANRYKSSGMRRSSAGIVSSVTRGAATLPSTPR